MSADDAVVYVHGKVEEEVAKKPSKTIQLVSKWLHNSLLHLNVNTKTNTL